MNSGSSSDNDGKNGAGGHGGMGGHSGMGGIGNGPAGIGGNSSGGNDSDANNSDADSDSTNDSDSQGPGATASAASQASTGLAAAQQADRDITAAVGNRTASRGGFGPETASAWGHRDPQSVGPQEMSARQQGLIARGLQEGYLAYDEATRKTTPTKKGVLAGFSPGVRTVSSALAGLLGPAGVVANMALQAAYPSGPKTTTSTAIDTAKLAARTVASLNPVTAFGMDIAGHMARMNEIAEMHAAVGYGPTPESRAAIQSMTPADGSSAIGMPGTMVSQAMQPTRAPVAARSIGPSIYDMVYSQPSNFSTYGSASPHLMVPVRG